LVIGKVTATPEEILAALLDYLIENNDIAIVPHGEGIKIVKKSRNNCRFKGTGAHEFCDSGCGGICEFWEFVG
jgi:hypothetical protein